MKNLSFKDQGKLADIETAKSEAQKTIAMLRAFLYFGAVTICMWMYSLLIMLRTSKNGFTAIERPLNIIWMVSIFVSILIFCDLVFTFWQRARGNYGYSNNRYYFVLQVLIFVLIVGFNVFSYVL